MPRSLPPKNILLLGATGQIGNEIRKAFRADAHDCRLICCSRSKFEGIPYPNEVWTRFDPLDDVWPDLGHVDVVINAIGAIRETSEMPFERVHRGVTAMLLQQRAHLGFPRIVQISALGADANHELGFLRSKGQADALLIAEPATVVLRPSIVCTPGTMLSQKLLKLLTIARFGFGKLLVPKGFPATQIQPILGSEVGAAVVNAAFSPLQNGIFELVGPERITFGALVATMATAQGRTVRLIEVSRDIMETFVAHFVGVWFPGLINLEQFRLLFEDNVGNLEETVALLHRMPTNTKAFWERESAASPSTESENERQAPPFQPLELLTQKSSVAD